jgi:hypothetical protein
MARDEISAGLEVIESTAKSLALSVGTQGIDTSRGVIRLSFERSCAATSRQQPRSLAFDLSREFVEDLPATKEYRAALINFLHSLSVRLIQPRPLQFMTLSGIPIDIEIHWPFRSAQDSDSDSVHVLVRTGSPWSREASFSVRIWGPDLLRMGIPSLNPPAVESLVVNSVRIFVDRKCAHFHPIGGNPGSLQEISFSPELFERRAPQDVEVREFIQRKVYWLGFRQGDDAPLVPVADPYDCPYIGCDLQRLKQFVNILVANHDIALDASGSYAYVTDELLRRADSFEGDLQAALSSEATSVTAVARDDTTAADRTADGRPPRVFISYSWDNREHKEWVRALATKLREDGIDAIIDQTHLLLGARNPEFMERSVRQSSVVLVICTETYKRRFDNREGGAGYEGHIITGEIINEVGKNKFVPILRTGDWQCAVPTSLAGTNGVDLRNDSPDEYQRLIKRLHGVSDIPPVGRRPEWLVSESFGSPAIAEERDKGVVMVETAPDDVTARPNVAELRIRLREQETTPEHEKLRRLRYRMIVGGLLVSMAIAGVSLWLVLPRFGPILTRNQDQVVTSTVVSKTEAHPERVGGTALAGQVPEGQKIYSQSGPQAQYKNIQESSPKGTHGWSDDFESYPLGHFPFPNWQVSGNDETSIVNSTSVSPNQSVQMRGVIGGCWAALIHRRISVTPTYTIQFYVRNGNESLSGCHAFRAEVDLHGGPNWTPPALELAHFDANGLFVPHGDSTGPAYPLSTWIKVRISYEHPDANTVRIGYWINDRFYKSISYTPTASEAQLTWLSLSSQEGTAWFDDVSVTAGIPPMPLP